MLFCWLYGTSSLNSLNIDYTTVVQTMFGWVEGIIIIMPIAKEKEKTAKEAGRRKRDHRKKMPMKKRVGRLKKNF